MKPKNPYTRRSLWLYVPLWLFFVYLFQQILVFDGQHSNNIITAGMDFVTLGVHEASHFLFILLPSIFVAAAGSAGEITFTVLIIVAALKARSYFAMIFGSLWLMMALNDTGTYMADARAQVLPLIGPGPEANHDWYFIFNQLGWLKYDTIIGGVVGGLGDIIGGLAILFGLWMLISMARMPKNTPLTLKT